MRDKSLQSLPERRRQDDRDILARFLDRKLPVAAKQMVAGLRMGDEDAVSFTADLLRISRDWLSHRARGNMETVSS